MEAPTEIDFSTLADLIQPQRIQPFVALGALARLIRDPQDTQQVAIMGVALAGSSQHAVFRRFIALPAGQAVIREKRSLAAILDDHGYLRSLPANSLGGRYLAFVGREGLSARGLIAATPALSEKLARLPEPVRLFSAYTGRDMHDLYHILTGYGRDELGEICVLAMSYQQLKIRAFRLIAAVGPLVVNRYLRRAGIGMKNVREAVREAARIGRQAAWIPGLDIESLLPEDLDALRARLNLAPPAAYFAILERFGRACKTWQGGPFSSAPLAPGGLVS